MNDKKERNTSLDSWKIVPPAKDAGWVTRQEERVARLKHMLRAQADWLSGDDVARLSSEIEQIERELTSARNRV